jgi:exonuclease III
MPHNTVPLNVPANSPVHLWMQGDQSQNSDARPGTQRCPPSPGPTKMTNQRDRNLRCKANINMATLNINGFAAPTNHMSGIEKWVAINRTPDTHKIAILALQETHLDRERVQELLTCFGRKMDIIISENVVNPRASAGVAFIINKALISPKTYKATELIPGRAIALKIRWHEAEETTLINVCAPNNRTDHPNFWESLEHERGNHGIGPPQFLLGDFNFTEDPIDRAPIHHDNEKAVDTQRDLRH